MADRLVSLPDEALATKLSERLHSLGIAAVVSTQAAPATAQESAIHDLYRGSRLALRAHFSDLDPTRQAATFKAAKAIADDYWAGHLAQETVDQLSMRIEQAYDQSHLLFRLMLIPENAEGSLASLTDAVKRLHGITNLGWAVLQFIDSTDVVETFRGRTFLAGEPPIHRSLFELALLNLRADGRDRGICNTDQCELARVTGAEVLIEPLNFEGKPIGILAGGNNGGDDPDLSSFETQLFAACGGYLSTFHANLARIARQEAMFLGTLRALTASIDAKDPYTLGHSERVALLARQMATALGLGPAVAERYHVAGLIHDVGKIGVPEAVLCKAGKLTEEEFALIRKHPQIGYDILRDIPGLNDIRPAVLYHHERFDGRGYPNRIGGEDIPLIARVLALADTFDAMSSNRSYRSKLPREAVLAEIRRCAGSQFHPDLAEIFVDLDFGRFDEALQSHATVFSNAPAVTATAA